MRRHLALLAALFALTLTAACNDSGTDHPAGHSSSKPDAKASEAADHNAADMTFAKDMIVHHGQAIVMARLATTRASSPPVKALAQRIEKAQDPEITTMSGWLRAWGEDVPSTDPAHGGGHGSMPGMMSAEEMTRLAGASGAAFDRMFLEMMIRHHEGAIEMAQAERKDGRNPDAKALAAQIETAQTAEIREMRTLLQG